MPEPRHSEAACARLLTRLLLEPTELLRVLAPEGWERSPFLRVFHPGPEQLAMEEAMRAESVESMAEKLDEAYEGDLRAARSAPLPPTVAAYRDVFGQVPEGWPHP